MRIIAGEARGRSLHAPRGRETRPVLDRIRESIFSMLDEEVEGAPVLDLFAGSGAFGLEAISRGARSATFVENDRSALRALERNARELGFTGRSRIVLGDALMAPRAGESYRIIFVDPPFALFEREAQAGVLLERVRHLLERALEPGGVLVLRHPREIEVASMPAPSDRRTFGASTVLFFRKP